MDDLVLLEYCFLINPNQTWQHLSQFEEDFSTFLKEHGMEGKVLDSINPKSGRRILYIKKLDGQVLSKQPNTPPTPMKTIGDMPKPQTPKQALNQAVKELK